VLLALPAEAALLNRLNVPWFAVDVLLALPRLLLAAAPMMPPDAALFPVPTEALDVVPATPPRNAGALELAVPMPL
jgi:hypothetical protein